MKNTGFEAANVYSINDAIDIANDGIVSKQLIKNAGGNITFFAFDKGQELSEHTAPFDAIVQVIEGVAEVFVDGERNELVAGDFIIMPANVPHALNAKDAFKMCLTMLKV